MITAFWSVTAARPRTTPNRHVRDAAGRPTGLLLEDAGQQLARGLGATEPLMEQSQLERGFPCRILRSGGFQQPLCGLMVAAPQSKACENRSRLGIPGRTSAGQRFRVGRFAVREGSARRTKE